MKYFHRYPADYAAKTAHLSMIEDGAYGRLLDWQYANEKPLPESQDELFRIARAHKAAEKAAALKVAAEFFRHQGWQGRAYEEIEEARPRIEAARANGKKGGRPHKVPHGTNPVGFPNGRQTENPAGLETKTQQEPTGNPEGLLPIHQTPNRKDKSKSRGADAPCVGKPSGFCLPDWIKPEAWAGFEEMRRKIRKPMTERARDLIVKQLHGFHLSGHDVNTILDNSTRNDWQDVYVPKERTNGTTPHRGLSSLAERAEAAERYAAGLPD